MIKLQFYKKNVWIHIWCYFERRESFEIVYNFGEADVWAKADFEKQKFEQSRAGEKKQADARAG